MRGACIPGVGGRGGASLTRRPSGARVSLTARELIGAADLAGVQRVAGPVLAALAAVSDRPSL